MRPHQNDLSPLLEQCAGDLLSAAGLRSDLATLRAEHEAKDKHCELSLETALMEMRRAEDGDRFWIAEPGEYHSSFT